MKPDYKLVTINDNKTKIKQLLNDLILTPRLKAIEWSNITKQTPNIKIGYPGQHLASLVLGMEGKRTGARGDDIVDGTEVKSCSRVDQVDKCNSCDENVLRTEATCPNCGSEDIRRNNDSKWLFSVRSEHELNLLLKEVPRIALTISDYPNFDNGDYNSIRIQLFEIWNGPEKFNAFQTLIENYYNKIYLEHKKKNPQKTPAPKNFWPYSYQFYRCCPIRIFEANVLNVNVSPEISISHYIEPVQSREDVPSIEMPFEVLNNDELLIILESIKSKFDNCTYIHIKALLTTVKSKTESKMAAIDLLKKKLTGIGEDYIPLLPLRDTDIPVSSTKQWKR